MTIVKCLATRQRDLTNPTSQPTPWRGLTDGWVNRIWLFAIVATLALVSPASPAPVRLEHGTSVVPFVDNRVCMPCHTPAFQDWIGSDHERAMQRATQQSVLGDFDQASFSHQGVTSQFFTKDGKFFVNTKGPNGRMVDFEIQYTFGVEPLQQYLIPLPGGRLQNFPIAWDTQKQRWFHLYPNAILEPGDPLHWTGLYQTWNVMCAECHSTNLIKNYEAKTATYKTTWSSINVSCQACHGPGGRHVAWAQGERAASDRTKGLLVDLGALDARGQIEACARCHARRHHVSVNDQHGRPLLDDFVPELLRTGLYHPDGQILDEVYVYGSFLQSKMYRAGVRCTDCHQPHRLNLRAQGNALCVQCHQSQPDKRFPALRAKVYDTSAHHFHTPGSSGAQCVNCHMPAKTYMRIDPRRDHSFRVPRPDLSVKLNTPNACTTCHQGRTASWAVDALNKWYGTQATPHYAEILAAGRLARPEAAPELSRLALASDQPAIVRATALELLRPYGALGATAMVTALQDPDALVRVAAIGGLELLPPAARLTAVSPFLRDPIRAVRTEAARVLASAPANAFTPDQGRAFDTALHDFIAVQNEMADLPSAHLNLAVLAANRGQLTAAEQSYLTALQLDPTFLPARLNLATLYNQMGRNTDAAHSLRQALELTPQAGELYYSLGLLLAEEKRLEDAAEALGQAARFLPAQTRVHYNYGLTLQHLGRRSEAETALLAAHQLSTTDARVLQALAIFYMQGTQWNRAATYAEQLVRLYPTAPGPKRMLQQIQQRQKRAP